METNPQNIEVIGLDPSYTGFGITTRKDTFVISTAPVDSQTTSQNCQRRCQEIIWKIAHHIRTELDPSKTIMAVVEGPSFNSHGHGFEAAWMLNDIYNRLPTLIKQSFIIIEVPPSTWKKAIVGKGNADKDQVREAVKTKFGVEFELDRGNNKCDSYALYKYGIGILEGTITYEQTKRRGKGSRRKKASRTVDPKSSRSEVPKRTKRTASNRGGKGR